MSQHRPDDLNDMAARIREEIQRAHASAGPPDGLPETSRPQPPQPPTPAQSAAEKPAAFAAGAPAAGQPVSQPPSASPAEAAASTVNEAGGAEEERHTAPARTMPPMLMPIATLLIVPIIVTGIIVAAAMRMSEPTESRSPLPSTHAAPPVATVKTPPPISRAMPGAAKPAPTVPAEPPAVAEADKRVAKAPVQHAVIDLDAEDPAEVSPSRPRAAHRLPLNEPRRTVQVAADREDRGQESHGRQVRTAKSDLTQVRKPLPEASVATLPRRSSVRLASVDEPARRVVSRSRRAAAPKAVIEPVQLPEEVDLRSQGVAEVITAGAQGNGELRSATPPARWQPSTRSSRRADEEPPRRRRVGPFTTVRICVETGWLAAPDCPHTALREVSVDEAPSRVCRVHVDRRDRQLERRGRRDLREETWN